MSPPAAAPAVRARAHAPTRPLAPPRGPRRISGPARPARPARPSSPARRTPRADARYGGLALGALALAQRIASHRLLDRLIRGRAWIALVAFALLGIVVLQLALLKLNTSIGRSIERTAVLQNQNAAVSIENSELTSGGRVEASAGHLGMSLVPTSLLKFLDSHPRHDAARAASVLSEPLQSAAPAETAVAASAGSEGTGSEASSEASASEASSSGESSSSESPSSEASSSEASSSEASTDAAGTGEGEGAAGGEASPTG